MNPKGTPKNLKHEGRPRAFKTEKDVIDAFRKFCDHIRADGFVETPTKLNFSTWMGIDISTVFRTLNLYCNAIKKDYDAILSEVLTEGAMTGKYQPTMTIFCLKNWCDWTDRQEQKIDMKASMTIEDFLEGLPDD